MAEISLVRRAADDYLGLDPSVQLQVRAAFEKLKADPRAYGEPLGNKAGIDLFGYFSIRAGRRIRLIYSVGDNDTVLIRVIGKRDRFEAHHSAEQRIAEFTEATREEITLLTDLLGGQADSTKS